MKRKKVLSIDERGASKASTHVITIFCNISCYTRLVEVFINRNKFYIRS